MGWAGEHLLGFEQRWRTRADMESGLERRSHALRWWCRADGCRW